MAELLEIDNETARHLVLGLQGLSTPPRQKLTTTGLSAKISELGYVQLDSINTVERAHHMILAARNDTYRQEQLKRAYDKERRLFENWTHDAAVIPMEYYPYWIPRFRRNAPKLKARFEQWHSVTFDGDIDRVKRHIETHGPINSRVFSEERKGISGGWWNWHGGKIALEYLWRTGELAVCHRENFQKIYDLTPNVIPVAFRTTTPDHDQFVDWHCRAALERLGFATPGDIMRFWNALTLDEVKAWCVHSNLPRVSVEASDGTAPRQMWARPDIEDVLQCLVEPPGRIRCLSPFDPLCRDRKRLAWLFGFDYRIEVFVPAAKRLYGYYVFPLLEGSRLIGRIDMKADRVNGILCLLGLWLEPGITFTKGRMSKLESELSRICRFAGLESWSPQQLRSLMSPSPI